MTPVERLHAIEAAAARLIEAIDSNLENRPWPIKYAVPWAEANLLRAALEVRAITPEFMDRIPRGPKGR